MGKLEQVKMIKILYCEDEYKSVTVKNTEEVQKFLLNIDIRQRLNLHRKINVYKINFDNGNLSNNEIINLFEISNKERRDELFVKLY